MGSRGRMTVLTKCQRAVLIGTILGDAHLEENGRYVRLKIDHSIKQQEYVGHKYKIFREHAAGIPKIVSVTDKRTSRVYKHVRFNTKSIPLFVEYRRLFYSDGKKIVPDQISKILISPLALAIWFMDDGARRTDCKALRLHTSAYFYQENTLLVDALRKNFDIRSKIHRVKEGSYTLYIPSNEAKKLCQLIEPHIIPSMRYKLL